MKYVELIVKDGNADTVAAIAEKHGVTDLRTSMPGEDGMQVIRLLVADDRACKLVFLIKDIRPRTWVEKEKARRAMAIYILIWVATLAFLVLFIFSRRAVGIAAGPIA